MKRLTIFTPTYNRAYILPQLYDSLCEQICKDFEWLIVDDGSTDHTKDLVEEWINEQIISIRYVRQENGGKMRAYNMAVSLTKTELFVCIDSDDQFTSEFVVKDSLAFWDEHANDRSDNKIAGMISLRRSPYGSDISQLPPFGTSAKLRAYYGGETTSFVLTDILRNFPYPSFEGENFVTDNYIYDGMDEKFLFLFHPYYSQKCDYHEDGYTMNYRRLLFNNPRGHREYHAQRVRLRKEGVIQSMICYISLSLFIKDHTMFSSSPNLLMTLLLYPLGCLKHLYDRYKLACCE